MKLTGFMRRSRYAPLRAGLSLAIGVALVSAATPTSARPQQPQPEEPPASQKQDLDSVFERYELAELDLPKIVRELDSSRLITLDLGGVAYDLELERHDLRAQSYRATVTTAGGAIEEAVPRATTFRGKVAGEGDSEVRLLVQEGLFFGYVRTANDWLFIDPAGKYVPGAGPGRVVVYREGDVRPEYTGTCGVGGLMGQAGQLLGEAELERAKAGAALALDDLHVVEIATDADFEFFQLHGTASNDVILGILNQVDGIYFAELNMGFTVTFQNVWATADDPYTTTDAETLLDEFTNVWRETRAEVGRDVAHLFTGKDLDGSTVGIAWVDVVCNNPSFAYGLSQDRRFFIMKIVAHELGHNFSARHDDQLIPPAAVCDNHGPLMCSSVQRWGANVFSQTSKDAIVAHVNADGTCLDTGYGGAQFYTTNGAGGIDRLSAYTNWRASWSIILAGNFGGDSWSDLLFYDPLVGHGEFYATDGSGGITQLALHTNWRTTWDIIVPGNFGGDGHTDLLFYDRETGTGQFYGTDGEGGIYELATHTNWRTTWDMIVPGSFGANGWTDLLFYDRETGLGQFYATDGAGGIFELATHDNWRHSWAIIVPGSFGADGWTDLLFYDPAAGQGEFYTTNGSGGIAQLRLYNGWRSGWDMILPGNFAGGSATDLLFYDRDIGRGEFYQNRGSGRFTQLRVQASWRTSWSLIVPGSFGEDGWADLLFYQP
jgi:hypothetical protein